ncbi:hypothetical protein Ddye_006529 [Dipteronia dyeriana]|uniref:DUF4283 domain-containing protein n=1 Tax=Dipteronia dyeriana TaxID=168575 RepID=A0AAE0CQT6_9ROSI|nr:hypothetical protein Ddye_006529 [Dipteronia dyeriana]
MGWIGRVQYDRPVKKGRSGQARHACGACHASIAHQACVVLGLGSGLDGLARHAKQPCQAQRLGGCFLWKMDVNEIVKLCAPMTLNDREGPVTNLQVDLKDASLRRIENSLVGKVLLPRMNLEDKQKIIFGGPWSINDTLIVLEELKGKGDIPRMQFKKVKFWIQIHNAPLVCLSKDIGRFLRSTIGEVVDIDEGDSGPYLVKFLRVWVIVDIDKPLRRCMTVDVLRDGVELVLLLKYERLPDFCYRCGIWDIWWLTVLISH